MIYLDNAATSFPKPDAVFRALDRFVREIGGNPGRSAHPQSIEASRIIFQTREKLAAFINAEHSERLIFTSNGTDSLNLAILGLLEQHDHVVTTGLEHNSVMRPLDFLQKERRVEVSVIPCSDRGELDIARLRSSMRRKTKAVIINHGSNVIGTIQPLTDIRAAIGDAILILDACQTVGNTPIDVRREGIDIICFSCHKSLFGIQGLGALYVREGIDLKPIRFGGTGSKSESTEQPRVLPDRYESGTPNTPGIAALLGGLTFIEENGLSRIIEKKKQARMYLVKALLDVEGVRLHGDPSANDNLPVVSMTIEGISPSDVGAACNRASICVRVGLHCAPVAHRTVGTFPQGTVRISPGYFTREEEVNQLADVLRDIVANREIA